MSIKDLFESVTTDKEMEEIIARYRRVFGSEDGKWVLTDMMVNLGYFEYKQTDPVSLERTNFALFLLKRLGVLDPLKTHAVVNAIMNVGAIPKVTKKK